MYWGPETPVTQFHQWLHLHSVCGATLFGLHQLYLPPSVWQSLVGFRLLTSVCDAWQRSRTQNLRRMGKNSGPILAVCGPKFMKFWGNVGLMLCNSLVRLSMACFVQKIFAIKSRSRRKTERM